MTRYTQRLQDGTVIMLCGTLYNKNTCIGAAAERLAKFEDLGYAPEELKEKLASQK